METLKELKKKNFLDDDMGDEDESTRTRMQNYTNEDSAVVKEQLYPLYCSTCGELCLLSSLPSELMFRRKDEAIVLEKERVSFKSYLESGAGVMVKGEAGEETQFEWRCKQCSCLFGWQTQQERGELISQAKNQITVQSQKERIA